MSTRHVRGLLWPFAVLLLGACAVETKPAPAGGGGTTQPGGGTAQPGGGSAQPGEGARGTLGPSFDAQVDNVCADLKGDGQGTERTGSVGFRCQSEQATTPPSQEQPGKATPSQGTPSKWAQQPGKATPPVPSEVGGNEKAGNEKSPDEEIAALLDAMHGVEVLESAQIERNAQSVAVRDYAHLMLVSHGKDLSQNQIIFAKLSIKPDESARSKGIEGGYLQGFNAAGGTAGPELDREYMRRQILEHQRAITLIDAVRDRVQDIELRCALEEARREAMSHLEMGCWVWASLQTEKTTTNVPGKVRPVQGSRRGKVGVSQGGRSNPRPKKTQGSSDQMDDVDEE